MDDKLLHLLLVVIVPLLLHCYYYYYYCYCFCYHSAILHFNTPQLIGIDNFGSLRNFFILINSVHKITFVK